MTDDSDRRPLFPPAMFAEGMQEASEQVAQSQQEMLRQMSQAATSNPLEETVSTGLLNTGTASFKARVQSGGRISVPEPERDALDIQEGDIVQTIVVPVKRDRESESES